MSIQDTVQDTVQALWNLWSARWGQAHRRTIPRGQSLMKLENRLRLAAIVAAAPVVRSLDGTGNNIAQPTWGSAGSDLLRQGKAAYGDGISTPGGVNRPSARAISNTISSQSEATESEFRLSNFVEAWGQFIDQDLALAHLRKRFSLTRSRSGQSSFGRLKRGCCRAVGPPFGPVPRTSSLPGG